MPDVEAADTCTHQASNNALSLGASLWGPATKAWREGDTTAARLVAEGMHGVSEAAADKKAMPQNLSKEMKGNIYVKHKASKVSQWFRQLQSESKCPNAQQLAFLQAVAARCAQEAIEFARPCPLKVNSAPKRLALIAPPGTGKSQCIKWMCRFFTECLGWTHGVQFTNLAPQNRMAALILSLIHI